MAVMSLPPRLSKKNNGGFSLVAREILKRTNVAPVSDRPLDQHDGGAVVSSSAIMEITKDLRRRPSSPSSPTRSRPTKWYGGHRAGCREGRGRWSRPNRCAIGFSPCRWVHDALDPRAARSLGRLVSREAPFFLTNVLVLGVLLSHEVGIVGMPANE